MRSRPPSRRARRAGVPVQVAKPRARIAPNSAERPPQLAVTRTDRLLSLDGQMLALHPAARPTHTLSIGEVLRAPLERREILLDRFQTYLGQIAGRALGTARVPRLAVAWCQLGAHRASLAEGVVELGRRDAEGRWVLRRFRIDDLARATREDPTFRGLLLEVFAHLLASPGPVAAIDAQAARLFLHLAGPSGVLRQPSAGFAQPKLVAWDLNGTLRKRGALRPGLADAARSLERRGAASLITTTAYPDHAERILDEAGAPFVAFFGGSEVRPDPGHKRYRGVAAAFGLSCDDARHHLAVVGDNPTDLPGDLDGVVFIHDGADTPASAIELLLLELEARGGGSFAEGLASLAGVDADRPTMQVELPPLRFRVRLQATGTELRLRRIPMVFDLQVERGEEALAQALTAPRANEPRAEVRWKVAFDLVAEGLAFGDAAAVLARCGEAPSDDLGAARAAAEARLRHEARGRERYLALMEGLDARLTSPESPQRLHATIRELAECGEPAIAGALEAWSGTIEEKTEAARPVARASLAAYLDVLRGYLAAPVDPAAPPLDDLEHHLEVLEWAARGPCPLEQRWEKMILASAKALAGHPEGAPLMALISEKIDAAAEEANMLLELAFDERLGILDDIAQTCGAAAAKARARAEDERRFAAALVALQRRSA